MRLKGTEGAAADHSTDCSTTSDVPVLYDCSTVQDCRPISIFRYRSHFSLTKCSIGVRGANDSDMPK